MFKNKVEKFLDTITRKKIKILMYTMGKLLPLSPHFNQGTIIRKGISLVFYFHVLMLLFFLSFISSQPQKPFCQEYIFIYLYFIGYNIYIYIYINRICLNRICSNNAFFDQRCNELEHWLHERGYSERVVRQEILRA